MPGSDHSGQERPDHPTASQTGRPTPGGEVPEVDEAAEEVGQGVGSSDSVEASGRAEAREGPVQASQAVPRRQDRRELERRMRQALRDEVRLQTEAWERKLRRIAVQKAILCSVVAGLDGVGTCGLDFGEGGTWVIRGTGRSTIAALGAEVVKYRGRGPMLEAVVGLPGKRRYWLKFKGPTGERLALVCQLVSVRADKAGGRGLPRI
ncbi:MAG: hypothetical protein M0Z87_10715 [Actinomycetota bacterium]|nr:hypothetical protein [Actinomycetota bacterium]